MRKKIVCIVLIITILTTIFPINLIDVYAKRVEGIVTNFEYTGGVQSFTAPKKSLYKLEVWGAQGGGENGGQGGYSVGYVTLEAGQTIYIQVGGVGQTGTLATHIQPSGTIAYGTGLGGAGGYNGGGKGSDIKHGEWPWNTLTGGYGGGGATSITLQNRGELKEFENNKNEVLIVAGGGGGCYAGGSGKHSSIPVTQPGQGIVAGGKGGGESGENGYAANGDVYNLTMTNVPSESHVTPSHIAVGATQTSGYQFGKRQDAPSGALLDGTADGQGGGGGGWYGGFANQNPNYRYVDASGSGGSGYIGGVLEGNTQQGGNTGNGRAVITQVNENPIMTYNYQANGGTGVNVASLEVEKGTNANLGVVATKPGWTHIGWNTDPNATTGLTSYIPSDDTTLYAIFSKTLTGTFVDLGATRTRKCYHI